MQGSVTADFAEAAKELIYRRATDLGLRFDSGMIFHERNQDGAEMVYLKMYERPETSGATGETIWKHESLIEYVFSDYTEGKYTEGKMRINIPELVIVRMPDGRLLEGKTNE